MWQIQVLLLELSGKCFKTFLIQVWLDANAEPTDTQSGQQWMSKKELKITTNFVTPSSHLQSKTTSFGICENRRHNSLIQTSLNGNFIYALLIYYFIYTL